MTVMQTIRSMSMLAAALAFAGGVHAQAFTLSSPDIKPGGKIADEQIFNGFGCTGKNISPELRWSGAPKGTKSFALLVHDPDAPTGGAGWWHWVIVNIPASANEIKKGTGKSDGAGLPAGAVQIATDFAVPGWGGPCPPQGDKPHRYIFTLHALKLDKLDVPQGARASFAAYMINANTIGKATLTGRYSRAK